jgi:hypothetical protein
MMNCVQGHHDVMTCNVGDIIKPAGTAIFDEDK